MVSCGILFQFYWIQVFYRVSCVVSCSYPVRLFCHVKESKRLKFEEETFTDGFKVLSKSLSLHLLLINFCLWNFKNKLKYVVWFKFPKVCLNWGCEKPVDMLLTTPMQLNFRPWNGASSYTEIEWDEQNKIKYLQGNVTILLECICYLKTEHLVDLSDSLYKEIMTVLHLT